MKKRLLGFLTSLGLCATVALLAGCSGGGADMAASSASAQTASESVAGGNVIIVGMDDASPPMSMKDAEGQLMGFDVDLSREALKRAGFQPEYKLATWSNLDKFLRTEKSVDLIWASVSVTEERKKIYAFTVPYIQNHQRIMVLSNSPITRKSDLVGRVIGVEKGTVSEGEAEKLGAKKVEPYADMVSALTDGLMAGKVDAVVSDSVLLDYYDKHNPGRLRTLNDSLTDEDFAAAFRKEDTEKAEKINQALASMKSDGSYQKIYDKWFGTAAQQPAQAPQQQQQ